MNDLGRMAIFFTYTNYRGETAVRHVQPIKLFWGNTEYHTEMQWILHGYDLNKDATRDFALRDCNFTATGQ